MSDAEKVTVLRGALETIREATFAEFQLEVPYGRPFNPMKHVCPLCRRASTAEHLIRHWALIQSEAARALRTTEDEGIT